MSAPFLYIAALRRTGSSALKDAFTSHPHSIVFGEPRLFQGRIRLSRHDRAQLKNAGVDVRSMYLGTGTLESAEAAVTRFKDEVVAGALTEFDQVGVKEIRHPHWRSLAAAFPGMRVLLTARDPRDIYLSLYHKKVTRRLHRRGIDGKDITPRHVADHLMTQFEFQREMYENLECFKLRYEDLCTDPGALEAARQFAGNDISGLGLVGSRPGRRAWVHGSRITTKAVGRWRSEPNSRLVSEATETADRMSEYLEFWGYNARPTDRARLLSDVR